MHQLDTAWVGEHVRSRATCTDNALSIEHKLAIRIDFIRGETGLVDSARRGTSRPVLTIAAFLVFIVDCLCAGLIFLKS